ncbi:hypothetical protein [Streptomyces sp. NPDC058872]|uniref:hypothetical protein n=1 Tax=Streptomyces sp. NPDC058872 TaxID=3346661 RepID=UPI003674A9AC
MTPGEEGDSTGPPLVWPGADDFREGPDTVRPGPRHRLGRALVVLIALAALVLAGISVVAFLRDGHAGHPPRTPGAPAPAPGHVRVRGADTGFCPGERHGIRTGRVHPLPCTAVDVRGYVPVAEAGHPFGSDRRG